MGERKMQPGFTSLTDTRGVSRPGLGRRVGVALALSMLAGTPASMAQFDLGGGNRNQPGVRDPMGGGQGDERVRVNEHMIVDLHVQDEDLATVLQMLSIQSQKNIIASRNVSATVTANLYGVTFYEALDAILHVNGYGYLERGNFIEVYTREELTKILDESRVRIAKVIKLNYLNGVDAAAFIEPLLSDSGTIKTNGRAPDFSLPGDAPVGAEDFALDSTLVVFDFEENVEQIQEMLKQLDTKPMQVLVEATILQTSLNEENAWGVDFSILGSLNMEDFVGGPLRAVDGLIAGDGGAGPVPGDGYGTAVTGTYGNTSGPGTVKFGLVSGDVAVFIRMLDEVTNTQILSRPNILTLNRQPARVLVGRRVGYLSTTATDTATTQSVEFLDTGTQLHFRPFVSSDGNIRMELRPAVSEAVIRSATDATGAAVTIPDEITNELTTNVMVRDGQTIVLGGLFRESTRAARRQVPFLGDLPWIGGVFRGHDDTTQRNEIIFMVTPTIVNDQILIDQGSRATAYISRVRAGSREGLLPWSREKQSSQLLIEAQNLARRGRTQAAIHRLQRSLTLNPYQPDAITLLQELGGRITDWPHRSNLDDIVHGEIEQFVHSIPADAGQSRRGSDDEPVRVALDERHPDYFIVAELNESIVGVSEPSPEGEWWNEPSGSLGPVEPEPFEPISYGADPQEPSPVRASPPQPSPAQPGPAAPDQPGPVEPAPAAEPVAQNPAVFDLAYENADLQQVLRDLAAEHKKNIIAGEDVTGTVTLRLFEVDFEEALEAVLMSNGYEFSQRGRFYHVVKPGQGAATASAGGPSRPNGAGSAPIPFAPTQTGPRTADPAAQRRLESSFDDALGRSVWGEGFWTGRLTARPGTSDQ